MNKILIIWVLGIFLVGGVVAVSSVEQTVTVTVLEVGAVLTVNSPIDKEIYDSRRVQFNISTSEDVELIEYKNFNDRRPRWRRLCEDCDEYGLSRKKTKVLKEGENNISVRASFYGGGVKEENISLFIDSVKPKISTTKPRRNSFVNGQEFFIKYTENNLEELKLFVNGTNGSMSILGDCPSGKNQVCYFNGAEGNIGQFDGQEVNYWFEVSDSINAKISRKVKINIDTIAPELTVAFPENVIYGRRVPFNISMDEESNLEYIDYSARNPLWRRLCTNCEGYGHDKARTKGFTRGIHPMQIRATDKAGNFDIENVTFEVDY